jgi:hypothetical protein
MVEYDSVDGESISFTIQKTSLKDLSGSITVRNIGSANLASSFTSQAVNNLSSSITVLNVGSKNLSSSITIQKSASRPLSSSFIARGAGTKALSSSLTIRKSATKALSSSITVRKSSSKNLSTKFGVARFANLSCKFGITQNANLSCSFWITAPTYTVERINNFVIQKSYSPASRPTTNDYATIMEQDVIGYFSHSIAIAAGAPNDITYRIQAATRDRPNVWVGIPNQVDVDITVSDPDNMGTIASFTGEFEKVRVQAKNKTPSSNSRAWAALKSRTGG